MTAFRTNSADPDGHEMLGFFIDDGGSLQFLTETTLSKASGKFGQKLKALETQMYQHARDLEFEAAAQVRDQIRRLKDASLAG